MYYRSVPVSKTLIRKGILEPGRYFVLKRDTVLNAGVFLVHKLFSQFSSYLAKLLLEKFSSPFIPALGTATVGTMQGSVFPVESSPVVLVTLQSLANYLTRS